MLRDSVPDVSLLLDEMLQAEGLAVDFADEVRLAATASQAGLDAVYEPEGPWWPGRAGQAGAVPADRRRSVIVRRVVSAEDAGALACRIEGGGAASTSSNGVPADVLERLGDHFTIDPATSVAAACRDRLDCATTSFDPSNGRRVGLHIDAWTDAERPAGACEVFHLDLNLGPDDRHFLFVPLSADRMVALLGLDATAGCPGARRLGQWFLAAHPRVPIVRVRLRPGVAYLAPVERVLHDGCSAGARRGILRITVEGDIGLQA